MNNMSPDKHISITIGGKSFPVIITIEEEALIRKVEKDINEGILELQSEYAGLSVHDCMAMSLITKSIELHKVLLKEEDIQKQISEIGDLMASV